VNIFSNQPRTTERGDPLCWGLGGGAGNLTPQDNGLLLNVTQKDGELLH
jgi:hypothetical protein